MLFERIDVGASPLKAFNQGVLNLKSYLAKTQ